MLSGGPDSACLAAGLVGCSVRAVVTGLHLNYGLREGSDGDERTCRAALRGVGGRVGGRATEPYLVRKPPGRRPRGSATRRPSGLRADAAATGSRPATRAAISPRPCSTGSSPRPAPRAARAAGPPRAGRRGPCSALGRAETRALAAEARRCPSPTTRPTPTPASPACAAARRGAAGAAGDLSPAAEENIAATQAELAEEAEAPGGARRRACSRRPARRRGRRRSAARRWRTSPPALRRLALRGLAERAAGRPVALGRRRAARDLAAGGPARGRRGRAGAGLRAVCEAGYVRFIVAAEADAAPRAGARCRCRARCRFGRWLVRAELRPGPLEPPGPDVATLDADAARRAARGARLAPRATACDRSASTGRKSLQDLFTDRGVPRSLRRAPAGGDGGRADRLGRRRRRLGGVPARRR